MLFKRCRGATLVETAFALPLAIAIIFLILWFAYIWFCLYTFNHAVADGARDAAARGSFQRLDNSGLISRVHNYQNGGNFPEDLFAYQISASTAESYLNSQQVMGAFDGLNFSSLPGPYLYAVLYMNQALKKGIGKTIKFPCDPDGSGNNEGPGCVSCQFLNPDTLDSSLWISGAALPSDRIHLKCRYQPDVFLIKPMAAMLKIVTGNRVGINPLVFEKQQVLRWYSDEVLRR